MSSLNRPRRWWLRVQAHDRRLYALIVVIFAVGIVIFGSEIMGSVTGFVSQVQPLVTFAITVATLVIGWVAGRSGSATRFWVLADVRYAGRQRSAQQFGRSVQGSDSASLAEFRSMQATLRDYLWSALSQPEHEVKPADLLARLHSSCAGSQPWNRHAELKDLLLEIIKPGTRAIIPRILYREEVTQVYREIGLVLDLLKRDYRHSRPVTTPRSDFADLVSRFTGSFILADGLDTRSRALSRLIIHHREHWLHDPHGNSSPPRAPRASDFISPYERLHPNGECHAIPRGDGAAFIPGDYDGRILNLTGIHTHADTLTGESLITLDTIDTCYRTTELSPALKCKGLASVTTGANIAPRVTSPRASSSTIDSPRSLLLNTSLTLVSVSDEGRFLMLASRGSAVRNAKDVLSAASGGVFEHRREGDPADADLLGVPDLTSSALREAAEELGIEILPSQATPYAVFLANIQGRPDLRTSPPNREKGQLVATAGFMALTTLTPAQLENRRLLKADWTAGRFEVEELQTIEIPAPTSPGERVEAARTFCQSLQERIGILDVNAITGALYVGAHFYSTRVMAEVMDPEAGGEVFPEPWWAYPWQGDPQGRHRLVVDPRRLSPTPYDRGQDPWIVALTAAFPEPTAAESQALSQNR